MATDAVDRKVIRDELVRRLTTALTGTGNPFQSVFGHDRRDFQGESPVLLVLSSGAKREQWGIGLTAKYRTMFGFNLLSFIAEADEGGGRTSSTVEDELDACEKALADAILDDKLVATFWNHMHFSDEESQIIPAVVGGEPYKMEISNLVVEVQDA